MASCRCVGGQLSAWGLLLLFYVVSPPSAGRLSRSHVGFRATSTPSSTSPCGEYSSPFCVLFAETPLVTACHVAKPGVRVRGHDPRTWIWWANGCSHFPQGLPSLSPLPFWKKRSLLIVKRLSSFPSHLSLSISASLH